MFKYDYFFKIEYVYILNWKIKTQTKAKDFQMSFLPDVGQSQHNKKIIQDLEERKRRAKSNAGKIKSKTSA